MDAAFLQDRIDRTKAQIVAVEDVVTAMIADPDDGGTKAYTLNTGQTVQTVTKRDLPRLETLVDSLMNRLVTLQTRQNGGGVVQGVPGW